MIGIKNDIVHGRSLAAAVLSFIVSLKIDPLILTIRPSSLIRVSSLILKLFHTLVLHCDWSIIVYSVGLLYITLSYCNSLNAYCNKTFKILTSRTTVRGRLAVKSVNYQIADK